MAQSSYPERPVRILYGFAGNEFTVRVLAEKLGENLGYPFIIESVTGAAGNLAADRIASAPPDGYTIGMLTGANIVLRPLLHKHLPYDPHKDLVPVSQVIQFPNVLAISKDVPAKNLAELVALARANPGALTFGHLGPGSVTELSGELLKIMAKVSIQGVPYRGPAPLFTDMIGGRITMTFAPAASTLALASRGDVRILAVTSRTRYPPALDIPTVAELGYPDFEAGIWFGLFVPVGTPQPIIDRLSQEVVKIMRSPAVREKALGFGQVPVGSTQKEFVRTIADETDYWTKVIESAGIRPVD